MKKEQTIVKKEIVGGLLDGLLDQNVPWYIKVWWRFKWKYEAVEYWWRKKRQTWRTGFPHEQAWNFNAWHSEIVLPRLKLYKNNLSGCPIVMYEKDYDHDIDIDSKLSKKKRESADAKAMCKWKKILDKMIWSFEHWDDLVDPIKPKDFDERRKKTTYSDGSVGYESLDNRKWDWTPCEKHNKKVQEGLDLFGKYYFNLWD